MAGRRLEVQGPGHRDHARDRIDGKEPARVVLQGVAHRVAAVRVRREGRYAHRRADGRVLGDLVGGPVRIGDRTDARFVDIRHRHGDGLGRRGHTVEDRDLDFVIVVPRRPAGIPRRLEVRRRDEGQVPRAVDAEERIVRPAARDPKDQRATRRVRVRRRHLQDRGRVLRHRGRVR